ncbi:MAG: twin-arginine translocation signal domain-containing protein [Actinobacteria bacterium]|nr:twin-arginine translocation signal domain-containing protein [Actinomycetota bacterium]
MTLVRSPSEGRARPSELAARPMVPSGRRALVGRVVSAPAGPADATLPERLVARASALLGGRHSRRRFLAKTAVVGSALAVGPLDFLLKPGTAYGYLCGTCSDGWTAFCCTINAGRNSCPAGSFVGGWWKADNAAYCCGAARYIIDCNASCPRTCSCRCSGASCDGRRTCCNQFRYGQCHQEISCYGPVVCRVATCTPPWQYDASCTATSATDNRTRDHGAPCVPACNPDASISLKYAAMGGASGPLGKLVQSERPTVDGTGRYALYERGSILWKSGVGAHEQHGSIGSRYHRLGYERSALGFPITDETAIGDGRGVFNRYEDGVIYACFATGVWETWGDIRRLHSATGGVRGPLGYPKTGMLVWPGGTGSYQHFEQGSIWWGRSTGLDAAFLLSGMNGKYREIDGPSGPLGWPTASAEAYGPGSRARGQNGTMYSHPDLGSFGVWGRTEDKYRAMDEARGALGWPTSDVRPAGAGFRTTFVHGFLYDWPGRYLAEVHGAVADKYAEHGVETGPLGWPVADLVVLAGSTSKRQPFQAGAIYYRPAIGTYAVWGPIFDEYERRGEQRSPLGFPTTDVYVDGSIYRCDFEGGRLTYDPATGTVG